MVLGFHCMFMSRSCTGIGWLAGEWWRDGVAVCGWVARRKIVGLFFLGLGLFRPWYLVMFPFRTGYGLGLGYGKDEPEMFGLGLF